MFDALCKTDEDVALPFEIDARWCTAEGLCGHSGKTISPQHSNMSLYASLYHIGAAGK